MRSPLVLLVLAAAALAPIAYTHAENPTDPNQESNTAERRFGLVNAQFFPATITAGQSTTFFWEYLGSSDPWGIPQTNGTCFFSGLPGHHFGGLSGAITVNPTQSLTVTVHCETVMDQHGFGTASLTVLDPNAPPTVSASFSPSSIYTGQSSTFSWSSQNATSCTSTGGISVGSTSGSQSVSPSSSMSVTVTCTGTGGSSSATANLSVSTPPPQPPFIHAWASPSWLNGPGYSWITWNASNATHCNYGGPFGSIYQYFSWTQAIWITCWGPGGSSSTAVWVTVWNGINSNESANLTSDTIAAVQALGIDLSQDHYEYLSADFGNTGNEDLLVVDTQAQIGHLLLNNGRSYDLVKTIKGVANVRSVRSIVLPASGNIDHISVEVSH